MSASFTRFAPGAYRSTNLVPVEIHKTGSGKTPWIVTCTGTAKMSDGVTRPFGFEVARFATLADAKTLALPLIRHPQGVAAAAGWALMAARKLEGFGGHGRAKRHDERMASYLIAWRTFTLASGATVQHFGEAVADDVTATYTLMPARAGGDGYPYFVEDPRPLLEESARELGIELNPAASNTFGETRRCKMDDTGATYDIATYALTPDEDAPDDISAGDPTSYTDDERRAMARELHAAFLAGKLTHEDAIAHADTHGIADEYYAIRCERANSPEVRDGMRAARAVGAFLHGAYCAGLAAKLAGTPFIVAKTYNGGEDGMLWEVSRTDGIDVADGGGWVNRVDALEVAVSLTDASPVDFGGSADPCDCGTVRGASGLYVNHVAGGHVDCTGTDAIVAARELARLLGTDVDVTDAARQSEAVRVLEWARDFAADCVWQDVTPDDIADMDADEVLRCAARHYDGGIVALVSDANALPVAIADVTRRSHAPGVITNGMRMSERDRYAIAAKLANDSAGAVMEAIATRTSYAGTRTGSPELWRDIAEDAADILADCDALTAARIVDALPTVALALVSVPDVCRGEYIAATIMERELRATADGMRGRGDDWAEVAARTSYAADAARAIAKTCRDCMRRNEADYFNGAADGMEVGMPRAE